MIAQEIWKPIQGYEGLYEISANLRIRSLDRIVRLRGEHFRTQKGKIMEPVFDGNGYLFIALCKNGIIKKFKLHRLVAIHFIPNQHNLKYVDHINADKSDNRIENLQWITNADNVIKGHYIDGNRKPGEIGNIKPVLQYTKTGEFVTEHRSVSEAQRVFTTNSNSGSISKHLEQPIKRKSAYGYIWKYKNNI